MRKTSIIASKTTTKTFVASIKKTPPLRLFHLNKGVDHGQGHYAKLR